jgi:hypothetical protein
MPDVHLRMVSSSKRSGMEAFKQIYNPDKIILIGDKSLSWKEFLKINPEELF